MTPYVIIGILLGFPLLLAIVWRVNTSFLFFSIMVGELLARYFAREAELVFRIFSRDPIVLAYADLAVLALPVLLTALILKHTLTRNKLFIHIIPLLLTGIIFAAFAVPLLPAELRSEIAKVEVGQQLLDGHNAIIGAVIFLQLVSLWVTNHIKHKGKKHGRHSKKHH